VCELAEGIEAAGWGPIRSIGARPSARVRRSTSAARVAAPAPHRYPRFACQIPPSRSHLRPLKSPATRGAPTTSRSRPRALT